MYEIGQQMVCVETHSMGLVKEGEIYTIKDLRLCKKCKFLSIDVGIISNKYRNTICAYCGDTEKHTGVCWFASKRFRPLDDLYNTEIEELMNEVNERQPFEI